MQEIFAVSLFALILLLIALELVNRMVAALLGAAILVSFGIVTQEEAATEFVDWNTIGLLAGMMVIVAIMEKTGIFEYLAIKSAQWGKAQPGRILILLALVTAFLSARRKSRIGLCPRAVGHQTNCIIPYDARDFRRLALRPSALADRA